MQAYSCTVMQHMCTAVCGTSSQHILLTSALTQHHSSFTDSGQVTVNVLGMPFDSLSYVRGTLGGDLLTCLGLLHLMGHLQAAIVKHNVKMAGLHPPQQGNLAAEVPVLAELLRGRHAEHSVDKGAERRRGKDQDSLVTTAAS